MATGGGISQSIWSPFFTQWCIGKSYCNHAEMGSVTWQPKQICSIWTPLNFFFLNFHTIRKFNRAISVRETINPRAEVNACALIMEVNSSFYIEDEGRMHNGKVHNKSLDHISIILIFIWMAEMSRLRASDSTCCISAHNNTFIKKKTIGLKIYQNAHWQKYFFLRLGESTT